MKHDPQNAELLALKDEFGGLIAEVKGQIADKISAQSSAPAEPTEKPKWSKENHPAFQPGYKRPGAAPEPADEPAPEPLKVGDTVLAKWVTGDKKFYTARITSITGSASAPIYLVKFRDYNTTESLRQADIQQTRTQATKRKADGTPVVSGTAAPAVPTPPPPPASVSTPGVISAAANINPEYANKKKEPSKVSDGPEKAPKQAKKARASKELDKAKSSWQDFQKKGKHGKGGKDSMFRTGEGPNARGMLSQHLLLVVSANQFLVGFTGSGQAMRKDPSRSRHVYQVDDNEGY